jgi:hypothetical protein
LIRRLHQIHVAIFLEECAAFNITPVQFSLLKALSPGAEMDQATIAMQIGRRPHDQGRSPPAPPCARAGEMAQRPA